MGINAQRRRGAGSARPAHRMAVAAAVVALAATALTVGPPAAAAPGDAAAATRAGKPDTGKLTPRLAVISRAATGGDTSIGARLATFPDNQAGGLRRMKAGRVVVDVRMDAITPGVRGRLTAAGAEVLAVSDPTYRTVTASVADADLQRVSQVDGVENVKEVVTPVRRACTPVISEGDTQLKANQARALIGTDGTGVTVGILSDSFDRFPAGAVTTAASDVAAGNLPGGANECGRLNPVTTLNDTAQDPALADEGRAMAQIVHDLAPGAGISFATTHISETSFAQNITALANAGARVIVDDVAYFNEPFYQDGPISTAVNNARAAGVSYFSAAGNSNLVVGGTDVGSYEATSYRSTGCPAGFQNYLDCHGFNPGGGDPTSGMVLANNRTLVMDLQWAQPRGGVTTDLDVCVVDTNTGTLLGCSEDENTGPSGTQQPFEFTGYTNNTGVSRSVSVVVARWQGPEARFKWIHLGNAPSSVEYSATTSGNVFGPTIFGHSGTEGAFSVGAVPFNNASTLEPFSSKGPMVNLFQPVPSTAALGAPQVLAKPDFVATDCVQNSFFPPGSSSPHRFCGTSGAAPHAAAVAALLLDANPGLSAAQVGSVLKSTSVAVGAQPATAVGSGLLDARQALLLATAPPVFTTGAAATFAVGAPGSYNVTAAGLPAPTLTLTGGSLPAGLAFGAGVLSGTPALGTVGTYNLTFTAANGVTPNAVQNFTLIVNPSSLAARFNPVTPARILDTRSGTGAPQAKVGPGGVIDVQITDQGGVPHGGVTAVVLNVTAVGITAPSSFLTAWPTGQTMPLASNLNYVAGQVVPNLVVVKVGAGGKVSLYNHAGSVDVVADVAGWYGDDVATTGSRYTSFSPVRILDTRSGIGAPAAKIGPGGSIDIQITGANGVPASGVTAVVLNVTAISPTAPSSWLTAWPAGQPKPLASNLNYLAGQVVPNLVVVKVGASGKVSLANESGNVDVAADLAGYFGADSAPTGARYNALTPARLLDTRSGMGAPQAKVGPLGSIDLQITGRGGVPLTGVTAVVLNVTVVSPTAPSSWLTAWPAGEAKPVVSNLNYLAGEVVPNLVVVKVGAGGRASLANQAGYVDMVADVAGWYNAE